MQNIPLKHYFLNEKIYTHTSPTDTHTHTCTHMSAWVSVEHLTLPEDTGYAFSSTPY